MKASKGNQGLGNVISQSNIPTTIGPITYLQKGIISQQQSPVNGTKHLLYPETGNLEIFLNWKIFISTRLIFLLFDFFIHYGFFHKNRTLNNSSFFSCNLSSFKFLVFAFGLLESYSSFFCSFFWKLWNFLIAYVNYRLIFEFCLY